ncbi:family 16 glycoside hydrolase [Ulvibacterium sp.]|uniref:family 16 glycoside hydrolase n=1 Tax=Ulvibacterium sp. TaxID=2665914 RepID=UPI003BA9C13C
MRYPKTFFKLSVPLLFLLMNFSCTENKWIPIYQGEDAMAFKHYLGIPDSSVQVQGLRKDSLGNYVEGLGYNDPLDVFTIDTLNDEKVIRISGEVIGGLILKDSLANYHLKLKFKWGDLKWKWMEGRPKDGGILYHQGKVRHELQIHEGDVGSYWAKNVILDIPAAPTTAIPKAIQKAKPYLEHLVSTLKDTMLLFDHNAGLHHFEGRNEWQIVIANPYNERPYGEWNTLELICWENHAVHMINGKVNMILLNSFYKNGATLEPLVSGRLTLQSEGAVVYFKDIFYRELEKTPKVLSQYLE